MTILHSLKSIALKAHIAVKVHLMESVHRNLDIALVLFLILCLLELEIMLNRLSGELDLLVSARGEATRKGPVPDQNGEGGEKSKEDERLQAAADFTGEIEGDGEGSAEDENVAEGIGARAIGGEGGIGDCGILVERKGSIGFVRGG